MFTTQRSPRRSSGSERLNATKLLCLAAFTSPLLSLAALSQPIDLKQMMSEVIAHQHAAEDFRKHALYAGHESKVELDGHGNPRKLEERDLEAATQDGFQIIRTLRRNGHALSPEEQNKDEESIRKQLAKAREHREHPPASEIAVSRFLELGRFSNPRFVMMDGRPVWILDYQGDPESKLRNHFEHVTRCMAGTVTIDQAERSVVRVDASFIREFKLAGGLLVDIHKGTRFSLVQSRVQPNLWLPTHMDATGSLRALLFLNFNGNAMASYRDYRGATPAASLTAEILPR